MPSIFVIEAGDLTVKDKDGNAETLGNSSQGSGQQLKDGTIRIEPGAAFKEVKLDDTAGRSSWFEDSEAQTLTNAATIGGTEYSAGTKVENEYRITLKDSDNNEYKAWAVEVEDGTGPNYDNVVGLTFEGGNVPPSGEELTVTENLDLYNLSDDTDKELEYSAGVPCFTAGALIETPEGPRPIEALEAGDLVLTRDNGPRPVRWIARRHLDANALRAAPHLRPILFEAGSLAPGVPARRTRLSPQHRVLMTGPQAELHFEDSEVFAKAKHLTGRGGVGRDDHSRSVTYVHLLLDRHEVLMADGMWSESFRPGETIRRDGDADMMAELGELFPDIIRAIDRSKLARPELRRWEAALLGA